jgi:hypothetical protein
MIEGAKKRVDYDFDTESYNYRTREPSYRFVNWWSTGRNESKLIVDGAARDVSTAALAQRICAVAVSGASFGVPVLLKGLGDSSGPFRVMEHIERLFYTIQHFNMSIKSLAAAEDTKQELETSFQSKSTIGGAAQLLGDQAPGAIDYIKNKVQEATDNVGRKKHMLLTWKTEQEKAQKELESIIQLISK